MIFGQSKHLRTCPAYMIHQGFNKVVWLACLLGGLAAAAVGLGAVVCQAGMSVSGGLRVAVLSEMEHVGREHPASRSKL